MVPGMTERDRFAADMRRWEWLADAMARPLLPTARPASPFEPRHPILLGMFRRGHTAALALGERVHLIRPRSVTPLRIGATGQEMA
jgi:hypothetical protein